MHFEVKLEQTLQDRLWSYDLFDILVDGHRGRQHCFFAVRPAI